MAYVKEVLAGVAFVAACYGTAEFAGSAESCHDANVYEAIQVEENVDLGDRIAAEQADCDNSWIGGGETRNYGATLVTFGVGLGALDVAASALFRRRRENQ